MTAVSLGALLPLGLLRQGVDQQRSFVNVGLTAHAILLYSADNDGNLPSAYSIAVGLENTCYPAPAGQALAYGAVQGFWTTTIPAGADSAECEPIDAQAWINSTSGYRGSYDVTTNPGMAAIDALVPGTATRKPLETAGNTMNGLLSIYPLNSVATPSKCPLIWPQFGNLNVRGGSTPAPMLICSSGVVPLRPCRFSANGPVENAGPPSGTGLRADVYSGKTGDPASFWLYGHGFNYASVDSTAHFSTVEGPSYEHPFLSVDGEGHMLRLNRCTSAPAGAVIKYLYIAWARPDSTYDYPLTGPVDKSCAPP